MGAQEDRGRGDAAHTLARRVLYLPCTSGGAQTLCRVLLMARRNTPSDHAWSCDLERRFALLRVVSQTCVLGLRCSGLHLRVEHTPNSTRLRSHPQHSRFVDSLGERLHARGVRDTRLGRKEFHHPMRWPVLCPLRTLVSLSYFTVCRCTPIISPGLTTHRPPSTTPTRHPSACR